MEGSNNKRILSVVASVVMLGIAGLVIYGSYFRPVPTVVGPETRYYMDLKTSELFVAPKELPPIAAPSGAKDAQGNGTGVLAFMFSCGDCGSEKERFVGFLESTDPAQIEPERQEQLAGQMFGPSAGARQSSEMFKGVLVAAAKASDKWVGRNTPEGEQIVSDALASCKGHPKRCWPSSP